MNCPKCLVTLLMSERQGVEIDYCPQCRGVFLDRGELDKLIERGASNETASSGPAARNVRRDDDDDDDDRDDRNRRNGGRRKSFLRELFD